MQMLSPLRLALLPLVLVLAGCGRDADLTVRSTAEVFVLPQSSAIQGRDGGQSGLCWGKSIWAYGDTVLTLNDVEGTNWHHNSFSVTGDLDAAGGIDGFSEPSDAAGAPLYLVPPTPDEAAFNAAHRGDPCAEAPCGARFAAWPGAPVFDAKRGVTLIPYGLVHAAPGDFNFQGVGQSFAIWHDLSLPPERPVLDPEAQHPTLLFGAEEPGYGLGVSIEDDMLYAFACAQDGFSFPCTLGRVAPDQVLSRAAWSFWDGDRWSSDMGAAKALFDGASILSVARDAHLGLFLAVYSAPLSNEVHVRTAPALTGPWSDEVTLFVADRKTEDGDVYDAALHMEYAEEGGRVLYVSHSRPNGQGLFGSEMAVVRVELE